jgi:hypothetical protein
MIHGNRSSIFIFTTKVHGNEQHVVSQIASIMGTLVQLKKHIASFEVECVMLRNCIQLSKDACFGTFDQWVSVNSRHG